MPDLDLAPLYIRSSKAVERKPTHKDKAAQMTEVLTHIMFQGGAKAAIEFYGEIFSDFKVESSSLSEDGSEIQQARVSFAGHSLFIFNSPVSHAFNFTPSVSLFVVLPDEAALRAAFERLAQDGHVLMPLDDYGFSPLYGWLQDRFGLSWQLSIASPTPKGDRKEE